MGRAAGDEEIDRDDGGGAVVHVREIHEGAAGDGAGAGGDHDFRFRDGVPCFLQREFHGFRYRPGDEKYIVCVSSQVGCAMGCAFCATGRMGFRRNLATWEIVDQVMQVRDDSPHPARGVVFMGMGEPFLNYARVMRAAEVMAAPCGLAIEGRAITISTVGIVPAIRRFTAERRPYRLIISLTAADSDKRRLGPMGPG